MKQTTLQGLRFALGIVLILFGLIGLVVPFLQGWLLIFAGVFMINPQLAKKWKDKFYAFYRSHTHRKP